MNLDQQCVSLDLARRLKELGVKQESLFYWCKSVWSDSYIDYDEPTCFHASHPNPEKLFSAFTVSEILEMLPYEVNGYSFIFYKLWTGWEIKYEEGLYPRDHVLIMTIDDHLPDALAKMLIYLIENKLVDIKNNNGNNCTGLGLQAYNEFHGYNTITIGKPHDEE